MPNTTITLSASGGADTYPITFDGNSIDVVPTTPELRLFSNITSNWGHVINFDLVGVRYTEVNPDRMHVYLRVTLTANDWVEPRTLVSFITEDSTVPLNPVVLTPFTPAPIWYDLTITTQLSHPLNGYGVSGYIVRLTIPRNQTIQQARLSSGYGTDGYSGYPNGWVVGAKGMVGYPNQFVFWDSPANMTFIAPNAAPAPPDEIDLAPETISGTHPTEYEHTEYLDNIPAPPTYHFVITDDQVGAFYQIEARNSSAGQDWVILNNWSSSTILGPLPLVNIYPTWYEDDVLEFRSRSGFRNPDGTFTPSATYTYGSHIVQWANPPVPRALRWFSPATEEIRMNELCEGVEGSIIWNAPLDVIDSGATLFDVEAAEHAVSLGEVRDFSVVVRDGTFNVDHTIGEVYGSPYPLDYLIAQVRTGFEYKKRDGDIIYTRYSDWVVLWDGVIDDDPPDPNGDYPGYVTDGPWLWLSIPRGVNQPPLSEDFFRIRGMWEKEEGEEWLRIGRRKVHILQEG